MKTKYTKEFLEPIVAASRSKKDLLNKLNLKSYSMIGSFIRLYNLNTSHFEKTRSLKYTKEFLEPIVASARSKTDLMKKLGMRYVGGNYNTVNRYIVRYDLDISHFIHECEFTKKQIKIPTEQLLTENSNFSRTKLKERLYKEGLKERKCEICGQTEEWNGGHMSLILDHINGVYNDNRIENLRIVCPNCNATLDTHCGKNNRDSKKDRKHKYGNCISCGCPLKSKNKNNLCQKCANLLKRKAERPPLEVLLKEVEELGYCGTGRKYGVSDAAIRKWISNYNKNDF